MSGLVGKSSIGNIGSGSSSDNIVINGYISDTISITAVDYGGFGSRTTMQNNESITICPIGVNGTHNLFSVTVTGNTTDEDATVTTRKNAAFDMIAVTVGAGLDGLFSNTGSVPVLETDTINLKSDFTAATTGTGVLRGQLARIQV